MSLLGWTAPAPRYGCAQTASPGCDWTARLTPVEPAITLDYLPMEHPVHGGAWPAQVEVGFYALPEVPAVL
jgi:hypothetical protein